MLCGLKAKPAMVMLLPLALAVGVGIAVGVGVGVGVGVAVGATVGATFAPGDDEPPQAASKSKRAMANAANQMFVVIPVKCFCIVRVLLSF
jgi:hypothetical protein